MRTLAKQHKEATADVTVGVGSAVVVHVEQPVIQVLVIVTTDVQTRVGSVEVPVIREELNHRLLRREPQKSDKRKASINKSHPPWGIRRMGRTNDCPNISSRRSTSVC